MSKRGLSQQAYEPLPEGTVYSPWVDARTSLAEMTVKAVIPGVLFGILFGAANAYLGLQAGLTISTSIPVAVLTVAAFRAMRSFGVRGSILEANISQTTGSASSSVASGVIFTLPALFLWGMEPSLWQMTTLAICGGLLGVLFMIPLRPFLIRREHGRLPYPEGTACAEVLVASEVGGGQARNVFWGLTVGAVFKLLVELFAIFSKSLKFGIPLVPNAQLGLKMSSALFGVGYILGIRIAAIMVGGGLLSALIIIPAIGYWGAERTTPFYPEEELLISAMSAGAIWEKYVRYIGAGAVASAGIITLVRSVPTMVASFRIGARQLQARLSSKVNDQPALRTERDLPLWFVGAGAGVLMLVMAFLPNLFGTMTWLPARIMAAVLVTIFAFFFVTVSSRIVGLVGVTSNPTSGMTIAALLGTATLFVLFGWDDSSAKAAVLCVGCVVAIAASIAGDTSQDLKTGFLLGATPRSQQICELVGVLTAAMFVCMTVKLLGEKPGFGTEEIPAPQAMLMRIVIDGVLEQKLPWMLVGLGVGITVVVELLRLPSLPFAVGVYLPVSTMVPVFLGGLLRWTLLRRAGGKEERTARRERGVLFGSGLVGGEGLFGVGLAGAAILLQRRPGGIGGEWLGALLGTPERVAGVQFVCSVLLFAGLVWIFQRRCKAPVG